MIGLHEVGHDYGRGTVLKDVSLEIAPGRVTVLCGPNAVGKTTLLRIMAGVLEPTRGTLHLGTHPYESLGARGRARRLAFMSQRFECSSGFSVRRILELARVMIGRDRGCLDDVVEALELETLLPRTLASLSTGQAQRVACARALIQAPPDGAVLLDEPLASLDPAWSERVGSLLRTRARDGATIVVSVHELPVAARLAEDAMLLFEGCELRHGPAGTVLAPAELERAFGVPFQTIRTADGVDVPLPVAPGS